MNQRENLLDLRALLLTLNDYNHNAFFNKCGTPQCALGHAAAAGIGGLGVVFNETNSAVERWVVNNRSLHSSVTAATAVFGEGSYDAIFNDYNGEEACLRRFTRADVIMAIDQFLETLPP